VDGDVGVAEPFLHHVGLHTGGQQQRRCRVPQPVDPMSGNPAALSFLVKA
jgi:hypothetical protein